jgi:DNA-binding winged helix-turn-helix (wHTH) protein
VTIYEIGPFHLRAERLVLVHRDAMVPLGPKVVETLLALVERAGKTVSKEVLMERVWPGCFVEEGNLAQNVYVLRKAFRSYGAGDPIETIPSVGYRLNVPARRLLEPPELPEVHRRTSPLRWIAAIAVAGATAFAIASVALVVAHGSGPRPGSAVLSSESARLYAIGRYYWNLRTSDGVEKSMRYFARVIDLAPGSPLGYAGMADANETLGDYCYGAHRPRDYFARARAYAAKAILLDPQSATAHATLGFIALHEREDAAAVAELQRAIAIDPSYAPAREWYGIALARRERLGEAWLQLRSAATLDPLSVSTTAWLSRVAYRDHRFDAASEYWRETMDLAPSLAQHPSLPRHPTWASIEDTVH